MKKQNIFLSIFVVIWAYLGIYRLSYYVWPFPLSQNWFTDNGLVVFKDIIYHHTPLPLFLLYYSSKLFGNTGEMLQLVSFIMTLLFSLGVYLLGKQVSARIGVISLLFFLVSFFPIFQNFNLEEMTAALFSLFATIFFVTFLKNHSYVYLFFSGVLVGCALMGKQVTAGIIPSFFVAYIINVGIRRETVLAFGKAALFFSGGVLFSVIPVVLYFYLNQALWDFFYWNVIFNLTVYPQQSTPYALKDGIMSSFWLYLSLIPGLYLVFNTKNKEEKILLSVLILNSILLFPSFFPSFLVYKMLPMFIYPLTIWAMVFEYKKRRFYLLFLVLGLLTFFPLAQKFYGEYVSQDIQQPNYILDYGQNELSVVNWLEKNTAEKEKIMNLGHHYITTLSKRLPANKYVYIFPWLVSPFEKSTREIINSNPRVVIVDTQTIADWPSLKNWGFLSYVFKNYKKVETFGQYEIYIKNI